MQNKQDATSDHDIGPTQAGNVIHDQKTWLKRLLWTSKSSVQSVYIRFLHFSQCTQRVSFNKPLRAC